MGLPRATDMGQFPGAPSGTAGQAPDGATSPRLYVHCGTTSIRRQLFDRDGFPVYCFEVPETLSMSQANIDLIQSLYAAFARGDGAAVLASMDPAIVWNEAENFP